MKRRPLWPWERRRDERATPAKTFEYFLLPHPVNDWLAAYPDAPKVTLTSYPVRPFAEPWTWPR